MMTAARRMVRKTISVLAVVVVAGGYCWLGSGRCNHALTTVLVAFLVYELTAGLFSFALLS